LASEFIGHTTRARRGVLPFAVSKEAILISPWLYGKGYSPDSTLILFHYVCMGIPIIELPY
jgi:hypothetical protein